MRLLLALAMLAGCASAPEEPAPPPKAKEVDLDALAARRASSGGAAAEEALAATRSANAQKVYASAEGERGLVEFEEEVGEDAAKAAIASSGRDSFARPGEADGPSDLDKAADRTDPWVNMDLVSSAIRRRQKSMQTCWDTVSMDSPGLGKRVIMTITVDTRGGGTARLAPGSPARHPELARCLTATLGRVDYPSAMNGSVTFDYPLNF